VKKKSTILRGALTLALVVGLFGFAISAAASPGEDEWDTFSYPSDGSASDWFRSDNISDGPGPMAIAIDGTLYVYATDDGEEHLFVSDDDGRTWSKTDYEDDVTGGAIVAIAPSSIDADVVYVADANYVYKTDDAGDSFAAVADASLASAVITTSENITCLTVGYTADDEPYIFFGTSTESNAGHVYYLAEEAYGAAWDDLTIGSYDVYGIGVSPDFASDSLVAAVAAEATPSTIIATNDGVVGDWTSLVLLDDGSANFTLAEASDPIFPADFDFDDAYEFFVGVVGDAHVTSTDGGVYRIYDETAFDLLDDIDADIISLDLVGNIGSTLLIAGQNDVADVWYSTDDGDNWDSAASEGKNPSGTGPTWVVMDEDFADTDTAWAAAEGAEGGVSLTADGGETFNQISMISTDLDTVESLSFSTGYRTDDTLFMVTSDASAADNLFRYDGDNWERIADSATLGDAIDMVQLSPVFPSDNTLFIVDSSTPTTFRSTDGGQSWSELRNHPGALTTWLVIDDETVVAGTATEVVWITTDGGRRAWSDYDVADAGTIVMITKSPNFATDQTLMLGDTLGQIFISEDAGETWDMVEDDVGATGNTFVAFDRDYADNNIIYAAVADEIDRCVIDAAEAWEDQSWEEFTLASGNFTTATGIATSADGTLYVSFSEDGVGMQRSLDPQEDDIDDSDFEAVAFELDAGAKLATLQLTAGSNALWSRNSETGATEEIWTYEDTLATVVLLRSPSNNKVIDDPNEVTFGWAELAAADEYTLEYTDDPDWIENVTTVTGLGDPILTVSTLSAGTTYYWNVQVSTGEPLLSRWSLEWNFTTALADVAVPTHWTPENGAQDIVTSPSFGWTAVSGADYYAFELANNPDFADATTAEPTINSMVSPMTLSHSTTYYWRVRAIADTTVISDWVSGAFTTMAEPVAPPAPAPAPAPAPPVEIPPAQQITPAFIWAIVIIGAVLIIALIVLIIRTRRVV